MCDETGNAVVSRQHSESEHGNTIDRSPVWIRLYDSHRQVLAQGHYLAVIGQQRCQGEADEDGWVELRVPADTESVELHWSEHLDERFRPQDEDDYQHTGTIFIEVDVEPRQPEGGADEGEQAQEDAEEARRRQREARDESARRRLGNLGLPYEASDVIKRQACLTAFKLGYRPNNEHDDNAPEEITTPMDNDTFRQLRRRHDNCNLEVSDD